MTFDLDAHTDGAAPKRAKKGSSTKLDSQLNKLAGRSDADASQMVKECILEYNRLRLEAVAFEEVGLDTDPAELTVKPSHHSREDSILPPILYGRHMAVSSPMRRYNQPSPTHPPLLRANTQPTFGPK